VEAESKLAISDRARAEGRRGTSAGLTITVRPPGRAPHSTLTDSQFDACGQHRSNAWGVGEFNNRIGDADVLFRAVAGSSQFGSGVDWPSRVSLNLNQKTRF
jgi:hypothetical protein